MDLNISLKDLRCDSLEEFPDLPPASDSPERKRLYFFWRGLESMLMEHYNRLEPWKAILETTGLVDEAEVVLFEELIAYKSLLETAIDWAARALGNCELLGGEAGSENFGARE